jgi:hypothetical protein
LFFCETRIYVIKFPLRGRARAVGRPYKKCVATLYQAALKIDRRPSCFKSKKIQSSVAPPRLLSNTRCRPSSRLSPVALLLCVFQNGKRGYYPFSRLSRAYPTLTGKISNNRPLFKLLVNNLISNYRSRLTVKYQIIVSNSNFSLKIQYQTVGSPKRKREDILIRKYVRWRVHSLLRKPDF